MSNLNFKQKVNLYILIALACLSFLGLPVMIFNEKLGSTMFLVGITLFSFYALISVIIQTKFNYIVSFEKNIEKSENYLKEKKYMKSLIYGIVSPTLLLGIIFLIVYVSIMLPILLKN